MVTLWWMRRFKYSYSLTASSSSHVSSWALQSFFLGFVFFFWNLASLIWIKMQNTVIKFSVAKHWEREVICWMKGSRSKDILTGWIVGTKPMQLNLTMVNERFCTGGRQLCKERVEQTLRNSRKKLCWNWESRKERHDRSRALNRNPQTRKWCKVWTYWS